MTLGTAVATGTVFLVIKSLGTSQGYAGPFSNLSGGTYAAYFDASSGANMFRNDSAAAFFGNPGDKGRVFINGGLVNKQLTTHQTTFKLYSLDILDTNLGVNFYNIGMRQGGGGFYYNGQYARIIVYNKRLTEAHRKAKEQELMQLYGLN
jgi:hypothetical protein